MDREIGGGGDRILAMPRAEMDRAYRLAGLVLGDRTDAEDATQEALLRAWKARGSLRDEAGFVPWFDRIVVNVCRDRLRRTRRIPFIPLEEIDPASAGRDPFDAVHDRSEALAAMRDLNADERIVLVLHYWADLTLENVALHTGWPVGTVKTRLHSALERIRRTLATDRADGTDR